MGKERVVRRKEEKSTPVCYLSSPFSDERLLQSYAVLDDPVVYDSDSLGFVAVGVGVHVRWRAVCRPAGVTDPRGGFKSEGGQR